MIENSHQTVMDRVFHVTSSESLGSIQNLGLLPDPERGSFPAWRETERLVDEMRPDNIIDMNISRSNGVFAHPYAEAISRYSMGMHKVTHNAQPIVVEVDIDPQQALVADAYLLNEVQTHVQHALIHDQDMHTEAAMGHAKAYWKETLSLADFRQYYVPEHTPHGSTYVRSDDAPGYLPYHMISPEVIIPGPVDPKKLKLAESVLRVSKY